MRNLIIQTRYSERLTTDKSDDQIREELKAKLPESAYYESIEIIDITEDEEQTLNIENKL